ncbi:MAG: argininosuccinate lyase [Candidatus Omnitrophica bacterium]|nr:argininosuccinate lyase [Candidatus Omnitrophota bacterium]
MSTKLWGSRFTGSLSKLSEKFTNSIACDSKLALYDCIAGIAHAEMLGERGIIHKKDASAIVKGLNKLVDEIEAGTYQYDPASEDVHTDIQVKLKKLVGKPADCLHTARSRNDQVVTDVRLYCLNHLENIQALLDVLQIAIVKFADKNNDVIIPAYTHLQSAQVVLLAHQMLAYVEMLERDKGRFADAARRTSVNTLGACALAGTTLLTDRELVTKKLGFLKTAANSMDAVSDRDFLVEIISAIAITGMHLTRVCEDLILWVTSEFNFISLDDAFCTGSSIMPHKKNPDVLELVRGTASKFPGRLMELLVLMKGLPLTYNRDMQMDKPALFDCVETIEDMLAVLAELFGGIVVKKDVLAERVNAEYFFSVDILDYLVRKGMTYRDAHDTVGVMVKECIDRGKKLADLPVEQLKRYSSLLELDVKYLLSPEVSIKSKKSFGSTNPDLVRAQINAWKKRLK